MPRAALADIVTAPQGGRASLADIATDPVIPDPSTFLPMSEGERAFHNTVREEAAPFRDPGTLNTMGGLMTPGPQNVGRLFTALKGQGGRLVSAVTSAAGPLFPKTARAVRAASKSWQATAPKVTQTATQAATPAAQATAPVVQAPAGAVRPIRGYLPPARSIQLGPGADPSFVKGVPAALGKVEGAQAELAKQAAALRQEFGSRVAGKKLFPDLKPAEAQAMIRKLAPGESTLPQAAQRAIQDKLKTAGPKDAWDYVTRAPNAKAREYLLSLMRGK